MRILVFGGHGKVARQLTPLLTADSHEVTGVIRNPDHVADLESDGATPVVADVESMGVASLTEVVRGADVVVWAAGAGGGSASRTYAVDRDAAIASMDAAVAAGVHRYVMLSYFGAGPDHGVPEDDDFHAYAQAKTDADEHLSGSDLAWTIVRPSALTDDDPTGEIETSRAGATAASVARGDVARVIAEAVGRPGLARRVIEFNNGSTPIPVALAAHEA